MSRSAEDYSSKKSLALTAVERLSEIIGKQTLNTTGLSCNFIVIKNPENAPLSQRALPTLIFGLEPNKQFALLRKWIGAKEIEECALHNILDWDYYTERFVSILQKIIIIPAILQGLENPMKNVECPDWLVK